MSKTKPVLRECPVTIQFCSVDINTKKNEDTLELALHILNPGANSSTP